MDLSNLKPAAGSTKREMRIGRGEGSKKGGTSGRGHKGAQSRSGYKRRAGFEGGQMPLQRRVPKRGFKNINRVEYRVFNLDVLQALTDKHGLKKIDPETLHQKRLIARADRVKILGRGKLTGKLEVQVHAISAKAKEAIESSGGSVNIIQ